MPGLRLALLRKPVWIVLGGAAFAQILMFAMSPVMARLYSPEAFGLLAIFSTSLGVAGAVMGGRYEYAIIGEMADREADLLVVIVICIAMLTTALLASMMFLPDGLLPSEYRKILPGLVLGSGANVIGVACNNWFVRRGMFVVATGLKIFRVLVTLVLSMLFITSAEGLMWGTAGGYLLLAVVALYACWDKGGCIDSISISDITRTAKAHINFPMHGAFPALLDNLSVLIPVLWGAALFNVEDVGQWGLSRIVLAAPLGMAAVAMSQVLMKKLHDQVTSKHSIKALLTGVVIRITIPLFLLCLVMSFLGGQVFKLFFGEQWVSAGVLTAWLIWSYAIGAICSMLSVVFVILRKLSLNGFWQSWHCLLIFLFFLNADVGKFDQFVHYFVVLEVVSYLVYAFLIYKIVSQYDAELVIHRGVA